MLFQGNCGNTAHHPKQNEDGFKERCFSSLSIFRSIKFVLDLAICGWDSSCWFAVGVSSPVLLTHKQVERILRPQEVVIIQDLHGTHPIWIKVTGNLRGKRERGNVKQPCYLCPFHIHSALLLLLLEALEFTESKVPVLLMLLFWSCGECVFVCAHIMFLTFPSGTQTRLKSLKGLQDIKAIERKKY